MACSLANPRFVGVSALASVDVDINLVVVWAPLSPSTFLPNRKKRQKKRERWRRQRRHLASSYLSVTDPLHSNKMGLLACTVCPHIAQAPHVIFYFLSTAEWRFRIDTLPHCMHSTISYRASGLVQSKTPLLRKCVMRDTARISLEYSTHARSRTFASLFRERKLGHLSFCTLNNWESENREVLFRFCDRMLRISVHCPYSLKNSIIHLIRSSHEYSKLRSLFPKFAHLRTLEHPSTPLGEQNV